MACTGRLFATPRWLALMHTPSEAVRALTAGEWLRRDGHHITDMAIITTSKHAPGKT